MNAVINDRENFVAEEEKTAKTERETDIMQRREPIKQVTFFMAREHETAPHYMSLLFHACAMGLLRSLAGGKITPVILPYSCK